MLPYPTLDPENQLHFTKAENQLQSAALSVSAAFLSSANSLIYPFIFSNHVINAEGSLLWARHWALCVLSGRENSLDMFPISIMYWSQELTTQHSKLLQSSHNYGLASKGQDWKEQVQTSACFLFRHAHHPVLHPSYLVPRSPFLGSLWCIFPIKVPADTCTSCGSTEVVRTVAITNTQISVKKCARGRNVSPYPTTLDTWAMKKEKCKCQVILVHTMAPQGVLWEPRVSLHTHTERERWGGREREGDKERENHAVKLWPLLLQPSAVQCLLSTCSLQKSVHPPSTDSRGHKHQIGDLYKSQRSIGKGVMGVEKGGVAEKGLLKRTLKKK